jgi:hypothetical protein
MALTDRCTAKSEETPHLQSIDTQPPWTLYYYHPGEAFCHMDCCDMRYGWFGKQRIEEQKTGALGLGRYIT